MRLLLSGFFLPLTLLALPSAGQVVGGSAQIECTDQVMQIDSLDPRTVIEWDSFSIAAEESVRFTQPAADSAVLNNVVSGSISHLMGSLESNGHVYIVNPNGIIIGKDALINVHSLIASTLRITNEDFLMGKDHFAGSERSKVVNLGTLRANGGDIHVISYQIENEGAIQAPEGAVSLSAASEAWLQSKDRRVLIKTSLSEPSENDGITNSGVINALQTELNADGNLYKFAINQGGKIDATALKTENGRVYLRAEKGSIKVSGAITAPGGHVEVLAERISIDEEALIDVSHKTQAGAILIGGDWHGKNTPFRADYTYLGPEATLNANGQGNASGGRIVLWGNLSSRVFGSLSACGGALGGDGGKIEISKVPLFAARYISTEAPKGQTGTLLLDPVNVEITATTTTDGVTVGPNTTYSGAAVSIDIGADAIETALGTSNVIISCSIGTAESVGNITVTSPITWDSANSLTLEALSAGTLQINESITATGSGDLTLRAQSILLGNSNHTHTSAIEVSTAGNLNVEFRASGGALGIYTGESSGNATAATLGIAGATVTISNAAGVETTPGDVTIEAHEPTGTGAAAQIIGGAVSITANNINISDQGSGGNGSGILTSGAIDITAGGEINLSTTGTNGLTSIWSQSGSLTISNCTKLSLTGDGIDEGVSVLIGATGLSVISTGAVELKNLGSTGTVSIGTIEDVVSPTVDISASSLLLTNSSTYVDSHTGIGASGPITIQLAGDLNINLTDAGASALITSLEGAVQITEAGDITITNSGSNQEGTAGIVAVTTNNCILESVGQITLTTSGAGYETFIVSINGVLQINECSGLTINNSSSFSDSIAGIGGLSTNINCSGDVNVSLTGAGDVSGTLSGLNELTLTSRDISISNTGTNEDGLAVIAGDGTLILNARDIEITTGNSNCLAILGSLDAGAQINAASLTVTGSSIDTFTGAGITGSGEFNVDITGSVNFTRGLIGLDTGNFSMSVGGSISFTESFIYAPNAGSCTFVANESISFIGLGGALTSGSSDQSLTLVVDNAQEATGSGELNLSGETHLIFGGRVRFFTGAYENNTITQGASVDLQEINVNGGSPDARNVYNIVYDPNNLPSAYTAPYTFYYKSNNGVNIDQYILLTATLVSSDLMPSWLIDADGAHLLFSSKKEKVSKTGEKKR